MDSFSLYMDSLSLCMDSLSLYMDSVQEPLPAIQQREERPRGSDHLTRSTIDTLACAALHIRPLLLQFKGIYPFLDVAEIQVRRLHTHHAGSIDELTL